MQLHIKNFRSIENLSLQLAPITLLYGHNGTGKSSALYAPLTLKNIVMNPEQFVHNFFQYGFANLGTFQDVIFDHDLNRALELGISLDTCDYPDVADKVDYRISCSSRETGSFQITLTRDEKNCATETHVAFPYALSARSYANVSPGVSWDGISAGPGLDGTSKEISPEMLIAKINTLHLPPDTLSKVDFCPFGKGILSAVIHFARNVSFGYKRERYEQPNRQGQASQA